MLEPVRQKKPKRSVIADFVILVAVVFAVIGLVQLCNVPNALNQEERDCLGELTSSTRKEANFTVDEVIRYGRCVAAQGGD